MFSEALELCQPFCTVLLLDMNLRFSLLGFSTYILTHPLYQFYLKEFILNLDIVVLALQSVFSYYFFPESVLQRLSNFEK